MSGKADFDLFFTADGRVKLNDNTNGETVWTSDGDDDFAEEFDGDFFDEDDEEEIISYLIDCELIDEDDEIDIVSEDLGEYDDDKPLEGELLPREKH